MNDNCKLKTTCIKFLREIATVNNSGCLAAHSCFSLLLTALPCLPKKQNHRKYLAEEFITCQGQNISFN